MRLLEALEDAHRAGTEFGAAAAGGPPVGGGPQFATARWPSLIRRVDATTREAVRRTIQAGLDAGKGADAIGRDLTRQFRGWTERAPGKQSRAELIARTETAEAYNAGALDQYAGRGLRRVLVYDGDYDEACADADGQVWTVGYARAHPIEHPNCVRSFGPVGDE